MLQNINFSLACAVLDKSDLYVGPEGGFTMFSSFKKKAVFILEGG